MRIGLIGDIHAEDNYLALALEALETLKPATILCVGDIADGPGSVNRCVDLLQEHSVQCVMGNHDRWMLEGILRSNEASRRDTLAPHTLSYISTLPSTLNIPTEHGELLLCHGLGVNDMAKLLPDDFDFPYTLDNNLELQNILRENRYAFVVSGHTHRWMIREYQRVTFINAGTLKRDHNPGFAMLETETHELLWFAIKPDH